MKFITDRVRSKIAKCIYQLYSDAYDCINQPISELTDENGEYWQGVEYCIRWEYMGSFQDHVNSDYNDKFFTFESFAELIDLANKYLAKLKPTDEMIIRLAYGIDDAKIMIKKELAAYYGVTPNTFKSRLIDAMSNFRSICNSIKRDEFEFLSDQNHLFNIED